MVQNFIADAAIDVGISRICLFSPTPFLVGAHDVSLSGRKTGYVNLSKQKMKIERGVKIEGFMSTV